MIYIANRKNVYAPKEKEETSTCLIPMLMDQNPAFPNIISIIHEHLKHLLNLDPALKKLVCVDRVFVSRERIKLSLACLYTISIVLVELP